MKKAAGGKQVRAGKRKSTAGSDAGESDDAGKKRQDDVESVSSAVVILIKCIFIESHTTTLSYSNYRI
jgi:hypothetical protein